MLERLHQQFNYDMDSPDTVLHFELELVCIKYNITFYNFQMIGPTYHDEYMLSYK